MVYQSPRVSIIIPTYNRGDVISRAISSVLTQTYDEFELIIVDDGSEDETESVVSTFDDDRIRYIKLDENQGMAVAQNRGIAAADGDFIATLDDDDEWIDEAKLTMQVKTLQNATDTVALSCTRFRKLLPDGSTRDQPQDWPENLEEHILSENGIIHPSTVLFRRDVLEEIGGFDTSLSRGIDSDVYRDLITSGYEVAYIRDVTTQIDERTDNRITARNSVEDYADEIEVIEYFLDKYADELAAYPHSRSNRYYQLSYAWYNMYKLNGKGACRRNAVRECWKSIRLDARIFNVRFFISLLLTFLIPWR